MKRTTMNRHGALALTAVVLTLGLSACSSADDDNTAAPNKPATSQSASEEPMTDGAGAQVFGPACSAVPTDGKGSFDGMVTDPVATAASNNPLLGTLVTAVGEAGLVDTLNDAEALTVFAPTDEAFAKIPEADLNAVLADKELLTNILTHHVVGGQLDPKAVVGTQTTLAGDKITIKGNTDKMTVDGAAVLCGNIPTANATVYVIDTVLLP